MTKLEVTSWQMDEIELILRHNPGAQEFIESNFELMKDKGVFYSPDVITLHVFFGPLDRLRRWVNETNNGVAREDRVAHIYATDMMQGLRARVKRIYDLDNDKRWFWENYSHPQFQNGLNETFQLEARYGRV